VFPKNTIIFSDVHGEPSIIAAVVEHSNYNPDTDRLIFAGVRIPVKPIAHSATRRSAIRSKPIAPERSDAVLV
jgi:hypothetical protein